MCIGFISTYSFLIGLFIVGVAYNWALKVPAMMMMMMIMTTMMIMMMTLMMLLIV